MPEPTPADALERMRRQVRAVRWRRNLHELQRALYHLLATLAAAAAALVVLALLSTPGLFAAAAWGLGAGSVLLAAWITRALRSEEHTSELQSLAYLVCRLLLEKKKE